MSWVGGPVDASDVLVDDTIGRTGATDLQTYLNVSRTTLGPIDLAWELVDLPEADVGVRTIDTPTLFLAQVLAPSSKIEATAPLIGLSPEVSGLVANSLGPGPAINVPATVTTIEVSRIALGNVSLDPDSVVYRCEGLVSRMHDCTIAPGVTGVQFHNVSFGDISNVFVSADAQGVQVSGTSAAIGVQMKAILFGGGPTPATYNALSVTGNVGELVAQVDAVGVGAPAGAGVYIDPAVVADPSAIVVRSSTGTPGELFRDTSLNGTDPRVYVVGTTPDRPTTPIGGIQYNDPADELLVAFSGGLPATSSVPSQSQGAVLVSPRATMEGWVIDTADPTEVIWMYVGKERFLAEFSWELDAEKSSGGTDAITFFVEKITGGATTVPDSERIAVPITSPSSPHSRSGGTATVEEGDEFRFRLTNASTLTSILIGRITVLVGRL